MKEQKSTPDQWFRRLIRLLPEAFRIEYGREMRLLFRDRYRQESLNGSPTGIWRLWGETMLDIFKTAPREHWDLLRQDTRSALRAMRRNLGFTFAATVTLALGIGANIGVFSLVDGLLLQAPFRAHNLVRLFGRSADRSFDVVSYPNYADLRDRSQSFVSLAAHRQVQLSLSAGQLPEKVSGELVSGNYFATFEVAPELGRLIQEPDDVKTARPVVVISHGLWQRLFGGSPRVLESEVKIFGKPFYVVGVASPDFPGSYSVTPTQVWIPLALHQQVRATGLELDRRGWGWLGATGRLREGVDLQRAQSEIEVLGAQLAADFPTNKDTGYRLVPVGTFPESFQSGAKQVMGALLLVAGLVLVLVLANLGGVMLARALQRRRDTAIRQALGATRTHLARLWLTESLFMSLLGGVAGVAMALATRKAIWALLASNQNSAELALPAFGLGSRLLLFSLCVIGLCAFTLGVFPAWRAGREAVSPMLKEGATLSSGRYSARLQAGLSIGQIVVSVVLLAAAGLLLRSIRFAESFQPGFDTANLWSVDLNLSPYGYDEARGREFFRQLERRLEGIAGVSAVTFGQVLPLSGEQESRGFRLQGDESYTSGKRVALDANLVGSDYFATMGIPIVEGRDFNAHDSSPGVPPVVVVSQALADRFWPGKSALGKLIDQGEGTPQAEVIGVARNIRYQSLGEEPLPIVFANTAQIYSAAMNVHLRTSGDVDRAIVRRTVASLDPNVAVGDLQSFEQVLSGALLPQRILGTATTFFGILALILTSIGLYALLSNSVQQRCHEFGIRMVLGAQRGNIMGLVLRRGLYLALVGVLIGGAASIWVGRSMESLLFGVAPTDPTALLVALGIPLVIALLASSIPARRAIQVDPAQSIRRL